MNQTKYKIFRGASGDVMVLIAAAGFSLFLLSQKQAVWLESVRQTMLAPSAYLQDKLSWFSRVQDVEQENRRLMDELARLKQTRVMYEIAATENARLKALLGFEQENPNLYLACEVVGKSVNGEGIIHINRGSTSQLKKGMTVMTDEGLVGRIVSVSENYAAVQCCAGPGSRVSARDVRSSVVGILRWDYGNLGRMEQVPLRSDIQLGDLLVTSGFSQFYAPGIPVGRVTTLDKNRNSLFLDVGIKFAVDFDQLHHVLVVQSVPPEALHYE